MSSVERAKATQLANIQKRTGKSLEELSNIIQSSGLHKHGEIRSMLMEMFGLGYGDASSLVHFVLQTDTGVEVKKKGLSITEILDEIYSGPRASLRPIHEKLMEVIGRFGEFEIAPKKGYVSLRRKRQFAMLGPATNTRFELGINIKHLAPHEGLIEQPAGSICNYKIRFAAVDEIDATVVNWLNQAYEASG